MVQKANNSTTKVLTILFAIVGFWIFLYIFVYQVIFSNNPNDQVIKTFVEITEKNEELNPIVSFTKQGFLFMLLACLTFL